MRLDPFGASFRGWFRAFPLSPGGLVMARLIVGIEPRGLSAATKREGGLKVVDLGRLGRLELRSQGVQSDDGTNWFWADVDDSDAADVAAAVNGLGDVVSAFVQPAEGPP
jgi:hypothetical protein